MREGGSIDDIYATSETIFNELRSLDKTHTILRYLDVFLVPRDIW